MTGSLLQLVAIGSEDVYITGNPQVSFYKFVYKRHSNFAMESIIVNFDSVDKRLSYDKPTHLYAKIERKAPLVSDLYLKLRLPNIYASNEKFRWINNIGTSIINYAKIYIGNTLIENLHGEYITTYFSTHFNTQAKDNINKMTGNTNNINTPFRNLESIFPIYEKLNIENGKLNRYYNTVPSIEGQLLYIPLPFWFSRYKGLELPLVGLENQEVRIEIELKPINQLYLIGKKETIIVDIPKNDTGANIDMSLGNSKSYNKNGEDLYDTNTFYKYRYCKPEDTNDEIKNYLDDENNEWGLLPELEINYIFLEKSERDLLMDIEHDYLIEKIIANEYIGNIDNKTIEVELFHPTKDLIIIPMRDDIYQTNQFSNFTNHDQEDMDNVFKDQNYFYQVCYNQYLEIKNTYKSLLKKYNEMVASPYPIANGHNKTDYKPKVIDFTPTTLLGQFRSNGITAPRVYHTNEHFTYYIQTSHTVSQNYPNIELINNIWTVGAELNPVKTIQADLDINLVDALSNSDIYNFLDFWKTRKTEEIPSIHFDNYRFFTENIIDNLEFKFNGDSRIEAKEYEYYNIKQPYEHYKNSNKGVLYYSFAIHPEFYQPSGSCNFTAVRRVELVIKFKNPLLNESINKNQYKYNIKLFTRAYDILRLDKGYGKLLYSV